ncbi:MAG: phage gp6-like head-tail connector protein [Devosia sp.]|uniref:head-tail connector protein n=1 Tax=Devosia sp. 66-22 TaxID=1895753 RepID=UPI00092ACE31|nr:head-tail connector protein [Devosia sp. 66-22]MBN9347564.1 phage gp6-like head-tail connector protein [Devosia sp.]OJX50679.1 MAG: hypothetical protein BGO81_20740 [Devosia sp. 66-22]
MALSVDALKAQLNKTPDDADAIDSVRLPALLAAATAKIEADLGYKLTDTDELPDGVPADLELAVLMTAADWYENREASIVGVSAMPLPFGVPEIVANYRRYTFAAVDDAE